MELNIPRQIRQALYILTVIGSCFVVYFSQTGHIGANEVSLWNSLTAAVALMAAFNLTPKNQ